MLQQSSIMPIPRSLPLWWMYKVTMGGIPWWYRDHVFHNYLLTIQHIFLYTLVHSLAGIWRNNFLSLDWYSPGSGIRDEVICTPPYPKFWLPGFIFTSSIFFATSPFDCTRLLPAKPWQAKTWQNNGCGAYQGVSVSHMHTHQTMRSMSPPK